MGLTTSQISGDNLAGFNKLGIAVGIFTKRNLSEKSSLKFEISYFQKGSKNNNLNSNFNSFKLNYIETPFYFNYLEFVLSPKYIFIIKIDIRQTKTIVLQAIIWFICCKYPKAT